MARTVNESIPYQIQSWDVFRVIRNTTTPKLEKPEFAVGLTTSSLIENGITAEIRNPIGNSVRNEVIQRLWN